MNAAIGATDDGALRPHDLLEVAHIDAVVADGAIPTWVTQSLRRAPFVVVRRARGRDGALAVGVRGDARHERFSASLPASAVARRIRPETLVCHEAWRGTPRAATVPHFVLLDRLATRMSAFELSWGPSGSVGYELASGIPTVTPASDIDLVVQAPKEVSRAAAAALLAAFASLPIRIDVLIETPFGAVALAEYALGHAQIALRTPDGARLVSDPWAAEISGNASG